MLEIFQVALCIRTDLFIINRIKHNPRHCDRLLVPLTNPTIPQTPIQVTYVTISVVIKVTTDGFEAKLLQVAVASADDAGNGGS